MGSANELGKCMGLCDDLLTVVMLCVMGRG